MEVGSDVVLHDCLECLLCQLVLKVEEVKELTGCVKVQVSYCYEKVGDFKPKWCY